MDGVSYKITCMKGGKQTVEENSQVINVKSAIESRRFHLSQPLQLNGVQMHLMLILLV